MFLFADKSVKYKIKKKKEKKRTTLSEPPNLYYKVIWYVIKNMSVNHKQ